MEEDSDYGAFMEKFVLRPPSESTYGLPLSSLTFAVKDIFDVDGYVTGFGNPEWARTHSTATATAPVVLNILRAGGTCVGKTVMDEMAYSINGENKHYGTPRNPCNPDRVPGGSSSGSAVAVAAKLVDFSLGTDTGGSVRIPASYCGILGFRPSHGSVSSEGVIPMAESFDTVGWFAQDPKILNQVGLVLLQLPKSSPMKPSQLIIADDCFQLSSIPAYRQHQVLLNSLEQLYGGNILKRFMLGEYITDTIPTLSHFFTDEIKMQHDNIQSLAALSSVLRALQKYEFKRNHGNWVHSVKPDLGPGISERVWEAMASTEENISQCHNVKDELRNSLISLIGDFGVLAIPTVAGPPPELETDAKALESFRSRAFSLLSIAGLSGFCQVSIPLGTHNELPVSVSLLAKCGSDRFLLNVVQTIYESLQEQAAAVSNEQSK